MRKRETGLNALQLIEELAARLKELELSTPAGTYSLYEVFGRSLADMSASVEHHHTIARLAAEYAPPPVMILPPTGPPTFTTSVSMSGPNYTSTTFSSGTTLFCNAEGCSAMFQCAWTKTEHVTEEARLRGWYVSDTLSVALCPVHSESGGGLGAVIPAIPPSQDPGMAISEPVA